MNDGARHERLKALFREALEQSEATRDRWLAQSCADEPELLVELRRLLGARAATDNFLSDGALGLLGKWLPDTQPAAATGSTVGAYRLLRLLGEGGMGRVYLAERADGQFQQQVALKLIRAEFATPELHQRFLRERETLARLAHPHIASLHDGGVAADGAPYFTLEYVDGEPLATWCDTQHLDIAARLRLLLKVCDAVDYAHRNLIVHRDLKPTNILVTPGGEPKLLDFGIAKPLARDAGTAELTATQTRVMTPEYAAPEQVLGDPVTTATDVYALGVLLYFLLCGRMPYRRATLGQTSWTKAILEESPEPLERALERDAHATSRAEAGMAAMQPSSTTDSANVASARNTTHAGLRRTLRGDLERIVQRALAKAPTARYPSVAELAADLRAFLDGRALSGGTRSYRLRKFVRRYWLPLTTSGAFLLVLVGGALMLAAQARQTAREAQNALAVKDFLFGLFTAVSPGEAKGRVVSARELLDRGAQRIEANALLDPSQKAELQATLGRLYFQLGLLDQASSLQERAINAMAAHPAQALARAQVEGERVETLAEQGDIKAAATLAKTASQDFDAIGDAAPIERAPILNAQALVAKNQRNFTAMLGYAEAELALLRGHDVEQLLLHRALMAAGAASWGLHRSEAAEAYYRESLAVIARDAGPDDPNVANSLSNIALTLTQRSRFAQARPLQEQSLAIMRKVLGADHPRTLEAQRNLALCTYHLGDYAAARAGFEQVMAAQRSKLGADHPQLAATELNLGLMLIDMGDLDAAETALVEAAGIFSRKNGDDYEATRLAREHIATVHLERGALDQAMTELSQGLERERGFAKGEEPEPFWFSRLGEAKRRSGDVAGAIELDQKALTVAQQRYGEAHRQTALSHHLLALALRDKGDAVAAQRELRAALTAYTGYLAQAPHPQVATSSYELGQLLVQQPAYRDEGLRLLAEAAAWRERFFGADDARTRQAREALTRARQR